MELEDLLGHIFKIQIPLNSNNDDDLALIYNKDRSITFNYSVKEIKEFMGKEYKKFASFHFDEEDFFLEEEDWQDW